jgi:hypothetical protein
MALRRVFPLVVLAAVAAACAAGPGSARAPGGSSAGAGDGDPSGTAAGAGTTGTTGSTGAAHAAHATDAPGAENARDGAAGSGAAASSADHANAKAGGAAGAGSRAELVAWLRARLPKGGAVTDDAGSGPVRVVHTVQPGETTASIARAYLDLTDVYLADDLARDLGAAGPLRPGKTMTIPHLLDAPYPDADHGRLGWPDDGSGLRGIFLVGAMAARPWIATLDRVAAHGMNAVVLDAKAYGGDVTYPSKVDVVVETGAAAKAAIPDLPRAIRFAHARGVRVIMRISCFHDPWAAEHAPRLSLKGKWGGPYPIGWLDPTSPLAHKYVIDLVKESLDAGADEIQLDYVRFPVQRGLGNAVLPPADGTREKLVKAFAHEVHEVTSARKVPLSLDVFGVTATGTIIDEHNLGQNIGMLGAECEALSPMVYPAHYDKGYMGWDQPGNHPEIIGIGTKAAVQKLARAHASACVVRPWLQAFGWRCPDYGPKYLVAETESATKSGSAGWLMWNPSCDYAEAWHGLPSTARASSAGGHAHAPTRTVENAAGAE